jgi:hypothetical protein
MAVSRPGAPGAGGSAQARYLELWAEGRRRRLLVRAALTLLAFVVVGWLWSWWAAVVVAALVAVVDTVYRWRTHEAVRTWRKGAAGERRTARMLRPLTRRGYAVLHDRALPTGRANVDHLVIGPAGVFVVDSKNWDRNKRITRRGRTVWVGRVPGNKAVRSVVYEARRVAEVLSRAVGRPVDVVPVVAVHGAAVPLLRASQVRHWITHRGARLSVQEVAQLSTAAERLLPPYTG